MRAKILIYAYSLITGGAFATSALAQQFMYPKNNQTPPAQAPTGKAEAEKGSAVKGTACLEGKGYTVK